MRAASIVDVVRYVVCRSAVTAGVGVAYCVHRYHTSSDDDLLVREVDALLNLRLELGEHFVEPPLLVSRELSEREHLG